jgi:DNA primase
VIDAAKEAVPVIDLADRLCGPGQMRRVGEKWTARCPLPGHDERTPSFTVYPGDRGWWCYGCQRGGDVVNLARLAWGIGRADVAAAEALMTFGHTPPERAPAWFARQERQAPIRARIADVRTEVLMRRLFRFVFEPMISAVEGPDERAEMAADLWRDVLPLAARLVEDRRRQA